MIELISENQLVILEAGELVSYQVDKHEFIHQKGSLGWRSSDTEMFPIIGPTNETDFRVQVSKGNAIQDQHGLLREMNYELISETTTTAVFKKKYKAGTLVKNSKYPNKSNKEWLIWPFSFEFKKQFELSEKGLEITFTVSGERDMPFMLGYHPAFKLHVEKPLIKVNDKTITLEEVLAVGSKAMHIESTNTITLEDEKTLKISTEGFEHFMLWTEVSNMICIEPITFYPYAVPQQQLHEGFQFLGEEESQFKLTIKPE